MTAAGRKESLLEALARVPDPRGRQGRRYQLASVLAMAVCAMACGARRLYAMAHWGKLWVSHRLGTPVSVRMRALLT